VLNLLLQQGVAPRHTEPMFEVSVDDEVYHVEWPDEETDLMPSMPPVPALLYFFPEYRGLVETVSLFLQQVRAFCLQAPAHLHGMWQSLVDHLDTEQEHGAFQPEAVGMLYAILQRSVSKSDWTNMNFGHAATLHVPFPQ
jgi:hypothetical protein